MTHKIFFCWCAMSLTALGACKNAPKEQNTTDNTPNTEGYNPETSGGRSDTFSGYSTENSDNPQAIVAPKTDKPVQNITVVPQMQVGLITTNMTETDIKKVYGAENVARVDRGDVKTAIFPKTDKELEITWKKGQDFKKLETAIIRKGDWKTAEGIGIGTTVKELNAINGKPVELFQREENYAMVRWKEGKVNPKLKVVVDTDTQKVIEMQIDF
jgi:hypothetical protein